MKFMVIVKATAASEAGVLPTEQEFAEMGAFNETLVNAGVMLAGEGLHPSSKGARIRFTGAERSVVDGPFGATEELIAGFWLIQVKSKAEAVEWLKRAPFRKGEVVEIRQLYTAEDFGDALTPELREQEEQQRARAAGAAGSGS